MSIRDSRRRAMPSLAACVVLAGALAIGATAAANAADAPEWTVDAKSSQIKFTGRQMNVPSDGVFRRWTATIRFDPKNLAGSSVDVTIETASAHTGNKDMDATLESEKFFEVKKFPKAKFVASSFRAKGGNKYEAVAKLTIRDVTQEVVLPFTLDVADKGAEQVATVTGKVDVSRTKFGIGRGDWSDTKVIADKVVIEIKVVASRKK